jgi:hypothetical protein
LLDRPVAFNRATVTLAHGDKLLVAQYSGPRLPEGCKTLPQGSTIKWIIVDISAIPTGPQ